MGDVLSCAVGYILGTVFLAVELWWLSIVWILVSEVGIIMCQEICKSSDINVTLSETL